MQLLNVSASGLLISSLRVLYQPPSTYASDNANCLNSTIRKIPSNRFFDKFQTNCGFWLPVLELAVLMSPSRGIAHTHIEQPRHLPVAVFVAPPLWFSQLSSQYNIRSFPFSHSTIAAHPPPSPAALTPLCDILNPYAGNSPRPFSKAEQAHDN